MQLTRRRFIAITAAAGGLPLLPIASARSNSRLRVWSGTALGCDATLQIHHPDAATADRLIAASLAEVERLERIMSLYRPDSALSRLNRDGALEDPPFDLVRVLSESRRYGAISGGAFDVTVQPLWNLYAGHFSRPDASPDGPSDDAIAAAVARVGQEALEVDRSRLRFARPGMGVTLNGIGQGYITDRVVELLRAGGVEHALVDMPRTLGASAFQRGGPVAGVAARQRTTARTLACPGRPSLAASEQRRMGSLRSVDHRALVLPRTRGQAGPGGRLAP